MICAAPDNLDQALARLREFWPAGAQHFRIEEEVLLPHWELLGTVNREAAARQTAEHRVLRAAVLDALAGEASLESLQDIGSKLAAHVRFEERELFSMIEADLNEDRLEALAQAVEDAESRRRSEQRQC